MAPRLLVAAWMEVALVEFGRRLRESEFGPETSRKRSKSARKDFLARGARESNGGVTLSRAG